MHAPQLQVRGGQLLCPLWVNLHIPIRLTLVVGGRPVIRQVSNTRRGQGPCLSGGGLIDVFECRRGSWTRRPHKWCLE